MKLDVNHLPIQLQPFHEKILATILPSVNLTLTPATELSLWQSKIGGHPYLPLTESYPVDEQGQALVLLAQINFAEVPALPNFPTDGILQFYIGTDDLYGADFNFEDLQPSGFCVRYFEHIIEDINQLKQDFSDVQLVNEDEFLLPFTGQYAVEFERTEQVISLQDHRFGERVLGTQDLYDFDEHFEGGDFEDDFIEPYDAMFSSSGHHLGGYPYFTQDDPRNYNKKIQDYILLFQLDTDDSDGKDIMWGDSGVGNFFIHPDDLKKRDFSKVIYNWDCC